MAQNQLRNQQKEIWSHDLQEPPLFHVGDVVWLCSKRTSNHKSAKLLPKFIGPFTILQVESNHTCLIEQNGCVTRESESRLKVFYKSTNEAARAAHRRTKSTAFQAKHGSGQKAKGG